MLILNVPFLFSAQDCLLKIVSLLKEIKTFPEWTLFLVLLCIGVCWQVLLLLNRAKFLDDFWELWIIDLFRIDFHMGWNNGSKMHFCIVWVADYPECTEKHCGSIVSGHVEINVKKVYSPPTIWPTILMTIIYMKLIARYQCKFIWNSHMTLSAFVFDITVCYSGKVS